MVRKLAPESKVLFCNADLHFLREIRAALRSGDETDWKRAETIREEELAVMREVDVVLSYNEVEHSVILSHNMLASTVLTCPWVVETPPPDDVPAFDDREGIAFLGGFQHPPNIEAVDFFVEEVVPRLREELPGVVFNIYGSSMPERFAELADETVRPIGYVEKVEEVYDTNRLFVAPLLTGAGIKGKVLAPSRTESRPSCHRWLSRAPGSATAMTAWWPTTSMTGFPPSCACTTTRSRGRG